MRKTQVFVFFFFWKKIELNQKGGRIGCSPPDVRNISQSYVLCEENDLLILVSDGIVDNLDPKHRGVLPEELSDTQYTSYEGMPSEVYMNFANVWRNKALEDIIAQDSTPKALTGALMDLVRKVVKPSQQFLENPDNMNKRLPSDYSQFPGKMDHTTAIVIRVCSPKTLEVSSSEYQTLSQSDPSFHETREI
jgi:hypothetical protein